jgi:hypothetical protein
MPLGSLTTVPQDTPVLVWSLAPIYAKQGRYSEAADVLLTTPPGLFPRERRPRGIAQRACPQSPHRKAFRSSVFTAWSIFMSVHPSVKIGFQAFGVLALLWHPEYASLRKMERFKVLMRKAGLVDYWHARLARSLPPHDWRRFRLRLKQADCRCGLCLITAMNRRYWRRVERKESCAQRPFCRRPRPRTRKRPRSRNPDVLFLRWEPPQLTRIHCTYPDAFALPNVLWRK